MKLLILLSFILIFKSAHSQETYNIKDPSKARFGKCKTCHKLLAEKPQEVALCSNIDEEGNVSLWFNDERKSYRSYLINARNRNKPRFCKMFESLRHGGISFQLLDNEYVKKMHCESCDAK